jgi:serine/threonine-protein kinase
MTRSDPNTNEPAPQGEPERMDAARPAQSSRLVLAVTEGPHRGQVFHFSEHDTFLVGRSKHAHFRLPARDEYFSRIHFLVEWNAPHCRLMDMGSTNGTFVNGYRVTVADLKDGDVIQGGQTSLRVTLEVDDAEGITKDFQAPSCTRPAPKDEPAGQVPERQPLSGTAASLFETAEYPVHQMIGDYRIVSTIGEGGMGKVHLAVRVRDNAQFALKTIRPTRQGSASLVSRFLREVDILRQLEHPNIVTFHETDSFADVLFFVMDFVPGGDAAQLVRSEGALPVPRAVGLVVQLLDALQYAHDRGFVHRDVKPQNLLISPEKGREAVKVVDFGLARTYQSSRLSGLTLTGQVAGTPAFIAPEQISNFRDAQPAADQYAAAATLYYLLTGSHVFDFPESTQARLLMVLQEEPIPIRSRRQDVPEALAQIIHRSLAKEPASRFPSVAAMKQALGPFSG